jgi:hypothetical protein
VTDKEIERLKHLLHSAVSSAYAESDLLENSDGEDRRGNEQTIVFRVGVHLHELLKTTEYSNLNLDCEYNKHGDDPKRVDGEIIRPDLLIHSRGNDNKNILVVEFAGWWKDSRKIEDDKIKLKALTNSQGEYRYCLGALVGIDKKNPSYIYYQNGEEISE